MKNEKSTESRRKLLKSIAAGSGAVIAGKSLPEKWAKPAVDSVLLPAHAQTSAYNYYGEDVTPTVASLDSDKTFAQRATDTFIHDAHAGTPGSNPVIRMSAAVSGSMATVLWTPTNEPVNFWAFFQSDLPTDGTPGTVNLGPGGDCGTLPWPDPDGRGPQSCRIVSYQNGDPVIVVEVTGGSAQGPNVTRSYLLNMGPGTATAVACNTPAIEGATEN